MYRAPAGRVHAFVEHVGDGVTVEIGDAGPNGPLGRGGNVRLGDAPLPPLSIRARTHERLGRIFRVVVALDASGADGSQVRDALSVTVNRCASGFALPALRHGDTVELATERGSVMAVLRVVEEGAPMPPARVVERDGLAIRTTTAGHAGGSVSNVMHDMARIARFLARKRG